MRDLCIHRVCMREPHTRHRRPWSTILWHTSQYVRVKNLFRIYERDEWLGTNVEPTGRRAGDEILTNEWSSFGFSSSSISVSCKRSSVISHGHGCLRKTGLEEVRLREEGQVPGYHVDRSVSADVVDRMSRRPRLQRRLECFIVTSSELSDRDSATWRQTDGNTYSSGMLIWKVNSDEVTGCHGWTARSWSRVMIVA